MLSIKIYYYFENSYVYLFYENSSEHYPVVELNVRLDDMHYNETIKYSNITPSFNLRKVKLDDGLHTFEVRTKNLKLFKSHTIEKKGDTYVFINFRYSVYLKGTKIFDRNLTTDSIYNTGIDISTQYTPPLFH